MEYYLDIIVSQNLEFKENTIMNHVYASLHQLLFDRGNKEVGCSFPQVSKVGLGSCLRLHGTQAALEKLMEIPWLKKFEDYLRISPQKKVPANAQHRIVSRVQVKSSPERLLRRSVKYGKLTLEEAEKKLLSMNAKTTELPYLRIRSISNGHYFRLFIKHGELLQNPIDGNFNHFGFSSTATIPWF